MDTLLSQAFETRFRLSGGRHMSVSSYGGGYDDIISPITLPAAPGETVEYTPKADKPAEIIPEGPPGTVLDVKHLHEFYDTFKGKKIITPVPTDDKDPSGKDSQDGSQYDVYAFTVIRKFNQSGGPTSKRFNVTTVLGFHSQYLIEIGEHVIGRVQGVSWTAKPLQINPQVLLGWIPELDAYAAELEASLPSEPADSVLHTKHAHLQHLLTYLRTTHATSLAALASLLSHDEITFELLWALFVPRKTILYILCPITGEPRAVRLVHAEWCQKVRNPGIPMSAADDTTGVFVGVGVVSQDDQQMLWRLVVEYIEADVGAPAASPAFGYARLGALDIPSFAGARKISSLPAYPIAYYPGPGGPEGLKERLAERGRKWVGIAGGMHHMAYRGMAFRWKERLYIKFNVDSRVMVDRQTFVDIVPNYPKFPVVTKTLSGDDIDRHARRLGLVAAGQSITDDTRELTEEELVLASPVVYGFSLGDKQWLEFSIDHIEKFEWNNQAFDHLVIPPEQKGVLKTLVESHNAGASTKFDDFVPGKGLGLVINLFGNPGTGKSLTAEAMSEYLRRPLYVVGAAELGTSAHIMDANLSTVLRASAAWSAVVLLDEADVFLEERSLQYLERNAMVAVFLRQLEYFRGIIFLTTNRVRVFDEAFQSRIHVSLRYQDLSPDARRKIWLAFMRKVNGDIPGGGLTAEELRELGEKKVNGRQIKNVVKTAGALAVGRQERFGYKHLIQVLDLMEEFTTSHAMYQ
ncbi:P-loop containing nucleoside triphosphate hydrolase protein [Amylocystis lapponica]|nr:P-loop containing nucleoside triphosphate hydrolase protein [Amylocystis lapponica]